MNVQGHLCNTALIWATLHGRLELVSMLLKHKKVDASLKNKAGSTALDVVRRCELIDIVTCLEEHAKKCLNRH